MNIIILCGGSGTRLWPLSRKKLPKQFLSLTNEKTMFQNTILRFDKLKNPTYEWYTKIEINKFIIICNKEHVFIIEEQLKELDLNYKFIIITEPIGRDTAPAIAIGCLCGELDNTSLVVPCDHVFNDEEFCNIINIAYDKYRDSIVTFGISPSYPETGYGYIEVDDNYNTLEFTEKPDIETANKYMLNGKYLWNAGVFMFKNKHMIYCLEKYNIDILNCAKQTIQSSEYKNNILNLNHDKFMKCNKISIDYAIMEPLTNDKTSSIKAITLPYLNKWSDIGSFKALHQECDKDENENVKKGNNIITYNTNNCYIESDKSSVATLGLENLVIVNTRDLLLVADKDKSQDIKLLLNEIDDSSDLKIVHAKAYRPWGWYINVEGNDYSGYKVKRIGVYPGKRLSLQSHNNRSEHWVICKGKARVQLDDTYIEMGPNEHVFIPVKSLHRMENIGEEMVEFVETQIGIYLGEDDIVRYEDDFGRA